MKLETENEELEIANSGADICNIRRQNRIVIVRVKQPRPLGAGVNLQSKTPNPATTANIRRMTGPRAFSPVEVGPYLDFGTPRNYVLELHCETEIGKNKIGEKCTHGLRASECFYCLCPQINGDKNDVRRFLATLSVSRGKHSVDEGKEVFDVIGAGTRKEPTVSGHLAEHRRYEYGNHPVTRAAHEELLRTRPLRYIKQNPNIVHEGGRLFCGLFEKPTRRLSNQWEKNADKILEEFQLDRGSLKGTLNNTKVREEVITGPETTQHVIPSREVRTLRLKYNPDNNSLSEVAEEITQHPDYTTDAARYAVRVTNTPVADLEIDAKPNTIIKRFSRTRDPKLDFTKVAGHWFCVVVLNGRPEIKKLARIETSFEQVCKIFLQKMRKSKLAAAKKERHKPNKAGLSRRIEEASNRIAAAYAESFIWNGDLKILTQDDQNNWLQFKGFRVEWGTDVTNSSTDRGQQYDE
jgi:hypothetical protein